MTATALRRGVTSTGIAVALLLATSCSSEPDVATGGSSATTSAPGPSSTTSTVAAATPDDAATPEIVNVWVPSTVDPAALPLGDGKITTAGPAVGEIYSCSAGNPNGAGAQVDGPWIDTEAGTWDSTAKVVVEGQHLWDEASFSSEIVGESRVLRTNDLPVDTETGTFPIGSDDPAYQYDRNPNSIEEQSSSVTLPLAPTEADSPSCLPGGAVGIVGNGVYLFGAFDEQNRDAVAHETQDLCDGHPQQSGAYHYHSIPTCILDAATSSSTVVGFAYDGFPIVVERDASGALPSNADLDECHGRTSEIDLDGERVTTYHYSATLEFPYFMGCFAGTPVSAAAR